MNDFYLQLTCDALQSSDERFEADFDLIADALYECEGITDQDLESDVAAKRLTFSMIVEATDEVAALGQAMTAVRTALHAAGGGTPGWEGHFRMARQEIERSDISTLAAS